MARHGRACLALAYAAVAVIRLWVVADMEVTARGWNLMDDVAYLRHAAAILDGHWLGRPFDELTLAKAPFYGMFIAASFTARIPLLFAEQLLYLLACGAFVGAIVPLVSRRAWRLALFAFLAFNPASYATDAATRVVREGIYPGLTLLVLAAAVGVATRLSASAVQRALWSAGLGIASAAFWLTREEGAWLAPAVGVLLAFAIVRVRRTRVRARRLLRALSVAAAMMGLGVGGVVLSNGLAYGGYVTSELKSSAFVDVMRALHRVQVTDSRPYVPVARPTRERLYAVSPSFRELARHLEGPVGQLWIQRGSCLDETARACDDIGDAWLGWAVRDATAEAGYYQLGMSAVEAFYSRIAMEVDAACSGGRLGCLTRGSWPLPRWGRVDGRRLLSNLGHALRYVSGFDGFTPRSGTSSYGAPWTMPLFSELTRCVVAPTAAPVHVVGRVQSASEPVAVRLVVSPGVAPGFRYRMQADPALESWRSAPQGPRETSGPWFIAESSCRNECAVLFVDQAGTVGAVPLDGSVQTIDRGGLKITVERLEDAPREDAVQRRVLSWIASCYSLVTPPMFAAAFAAYLLTAYLVAAGRRGRAMLVVETALLLVVASRLALVALFETTSFHAVTMLYASPAYPFMLAFIALSFASVAAARWRRG